jgi:hypothetical protein
MGDAKNLICFRSLQPAKQKMSFTGAMPQIKNRPEILIRPICLVRYQRKLSVYQHYFSNFNFRQHDTLLCNITPILQDPKQQVNRGLLVPIFTKFLPAHLLLKVSS